MKKALVQFLCNVTLAAALVAVVGVVGFLGWVLYRLVLFIPTESGWVAFVLGLGVLVGGVGFLALLNFIGALLQLGSSAADRPDVPSAEGP